jgi:hypothetical protein
MKCCLDSLGSLGNLMTWLSFFKDSWSNITSDLRWLRPVVQLEDMPSLIKNEF